MSDIVGRLRAATLDKDNFPRMDSERWLPVGLAKEAADEIERLRAYAMHERSLGAEGPMIELMTAKQEIERLRAEVAEWKERYEGERRDHETTIAQCDKIMNEGP